MKIHHVGCVSKNIQKDLELIKKQFPVKSTTDIVYDDLQKAYLCLLEVEGGLNIELVSGEQVAHLQKKGHTYYHLCYSVLDIEKSIAAYQASGALLVSPPKPAILFGGKKVAFVYTALGLVELLEDPSCL